MELDKSDQDLEFDLARTNSNNSIKSQGQKGLDNGYEANKNKSKSLSMRDDTYGKSD